jgi:hypothetical protein
LGRKTGRDRITGQKEKNRTKGKENKDRTEECDRTKGQAGQIDRAEG